MKKKSLWRAKLMARMAKDGDVEGLAEIITELMEEPAEPALAAESVPAADPVVAAVVGAVAENLEPAAAAAIPAAPAPEAQVVVETPTEQPVVIDCGPQILEALQRIIALLSAGTDCTAPAQQDADPTAAETAAVETVAAEAAENLAEAAVEAVAQAIDPDLTTTVDEEETDPVEALVAEILEPGGEAEAAVPGAEGEILSSILEPEDAADEDTPDENAQAADALRAALASFRPQLQRMNPKERQRFNADVAARMKQLQTRAARTGRPNAYAALRQAAAHDASDRSLGEKIMSRRNANLKT